MLLGQLIAMANESFRKEIERRAGSTLEEAERRVLRKRAAMTRTLD